MTASCRVYPVAATGMTRDMALANANKVGESPKFTEILYEKDNFLEWIVRLNTTA